MRLDTRQKIAVAFSVVFFIIWITVLAMLTETEYKGSITNATFTATVGCVAVIIFYVLIFAGKAQVGVKLAKEDADKVKSNIIDAYIAVLYVLIAGFFMMSVATLLVAYDIKQVRKFNWVGAAVLVTLLMLAVAVVCSYLKIRATERRYSIQEHNDSLDAACEEQDENKSEN